MAQEQDTDATDPRSPRGFAQEAMANLQRYIRLTEEGNEPLDYLASAVRNLAYGLLTQERREEAAAEFRAAFESAG